MAEEVIIKIATDADLSDAETLEDLIEKIRSEASNIPLDFDETPAEDDVDNLTEKLDGLSTVAVGQVLSQYGAEAEGMAQEMNSAAISVGQLATNVGMAEPQMVSMINHISNATFPQNEAMAYVSALNQMGVSANQLGDSATNMDRINDATGIGYTKVMQLTQGLQAVGVQANNLPSSFNAIAYAQANVNGGADTLSMVLKRQAATINEYGLNVDQLVLIMQKLSERGVQGMKMGSELSKVLKETNGDTQALEQSLGLQAGALSNASAATGQYQGKLQELADEEMEHKTWLDQLNAAWEDFSLSMSPILSPLSSIMGLIGQAGSWAVGVNGLIQLAQTTRASAAAQWLLNIAMDANPIMIVVLAIIALIAALTYLYFNNEQVRAAIDALGATLQWVASVIWGTITAAIQWLANAFQQFTSQLGLNTNDWVQAILGFILFIPTLPIRVGVALANTLARALGFKGNFVQSMISAASSAVTGFVSYITQIPGIVLGEFNRVLGMVNDFINSLPQRVWDMGAAIIDALKASLGIGSPGHMYYMMEGELKRLENLPGDMETDITGNISKLGSGIVDSFNPNLSTMNGAVASGSIGYGNVNNIYISDIVVDNEERVDRLCDAIARRINWNNTTAGRGV